MAEKVTPTHYTLMYPIIRETKAADGTTREDIIREAGHTFTLRRAKARHLEQFSKIKNEVEQSYATMAFVTGLDIDQVRDMDTADLSALGELLEVFMTGGPATGEAA